jgi:hypothetical protein
MRERYDKREQEQHHNPDDDQEVRERDLDYAPAKAVSFPDSKPEATLAGIEATIDEIMPILHHASASGTRLQRVRAPVMIREPTGGSTPHQSAGTAGQRSRSRRISRTSGAG